MNQGRALNDSSVIILFSLFTTNWLLLESHFPVVVNRLSSKQARTGLPIQKYGKKKMTNLSTVSNLSNHPDNFSNQSTPTEKYQSKERR